MLNKPKNKPRICKTRQNYAKYKTKNRLNINNLHIITKLCKIYDLIPVSPQAKQFVTSAFNAEVFFMQKRGL